MNPRGAIAFALASLTVLGACNDQIHLGTESSYWSANHETGDLSQWTEGGDVAGGQLLSSSATLTVVTSPTHGGRYAARAAISATGSVSYARLFRWGALPQDAYYGVWMLIPARYSLGQYWNVVEFQGRDDPADSATLAYLWSLDLERRSDGELNFYLYDGQRGRRIDPSVTQVAPIGRWFRVEAFVHQARDNTGRVTFWIDGSLFLDVSGVSTVPSPWLSWIVGSAAPSITEQPAEIFLDDATIARTGSAK